MSFSWLLFQDPSLPIRELQHAADWFGTASVATVLGLFLLGVCWYFIKRQGAMEKEHKAEKDAIRADYTTVIEQKNTVIDQLAKQIEQVTEQANKRLDRMVQMIADGAAGTQGVLSENAVAMATNQQALQDLKGEIQQLRQAVDRIRGGGT